MIKITTGTMNIYFFLIVIFAVIYTSWAAAYRSGPSTNKGNVLLILSNKGNLIKYFDFKIFLVNAMCNRRKGVTPKVLTRPLEIANKLLATMTGLMKFTRMW